MKLNESCRRWHLLSAIILATSALCASAATTPSTDATVSTDPEFGRYQIRTIPFSADLRLRTATYTPSGKVLVAYWPEGRSDERHLDLAVIDDDGGNLRPFFSQKIPVREKDNGIRFMIFADNQRIFLGDFIIECAPSIDTCDRSQLLPVEYPAEVAGGNVIAHRWSEIITAPDNEHIAWTTLLANYSAMVFTGRLERRENDYRIVDTQIISTLEPFSADPRHAGGSLPNPIRNGEVKQFVKGGAAISMVGAFRRDTADSVVQDLVSGVVTPVTDTAGYNETTIFSPDEKLGITMSPRFSPATDLPILGLMPRPYPASLNMGLNMHAYTHTVTGVRLARSGNIGPVLIDIERSARQPEYRGLDLNTQDEWVFHSPMSWHPGGRKAMWLEGRRGPDSRFGKEIRLQMVHLLDHQPDTPVAAQPMPTRIPYASTDLSAVAKLAANANATDVTIHGRHSGRIDYHRSAGGVIEKVYVDFSDDGESIYRGSEKMVLNPRGNSTYSADVTLSGPHSGRMDLKMTFGPLHDALPSRLIFANDDTGAPLTRGHSEYDGKRLSVERLIP